VPAPLLLSDVAARRFIVRLRVAHQLAQFGWFRTSRRTFPGAKREGDTSLGQVFDDHARTETLDEGADVFEIAV
jgi:hypothetical protein